MFRTSPSVITRSFTEIRHLKFTEMNGRLRGSNYSVIGDTISCDAPYSAIGFRGKLFLRYPPCKACLWIAIGHFYGKKSQRILSGYFLPCGLFLIFKVKVILAGYFLQCKVIFLPPIARLFWRVHCPHCKVIQEGPLSSIFQLESLNWAPRGLLLCVRFEIDLSFMAADTTSIDFKFNVEGTKMNLNHLHYTSCQVFCVVRMWWWVDMVSVDLTCKTQRPDLPSQDLSEV